MGHALSVDLVEEIRRIALALPDATEELTWDDVNFRVRKNKEPLFRQPPNDRLGDIIRGDDTVDTCRTAVFNGTVVKPLTVQDAGLVPWAESGTRIRVRGSLRS